MLQQKHQLKPSNIGSFDTNEACDVVCAAIRGTLDTMSAHFLDANAKPSHQLLIKSLELRALRKCLDLASREFEVIEENQKEDSKNYEGGEISFPELPIELVANIFAIAHRTGVEVISFHKNRLGRSSLGEVIRRLHPEHELRRLVLSNITYPIDSTSAFVRHRDSIEDLRTELHESDPARLAVTLTPRHYGEYEQFCSDLSRMPHRLHSLNIQIDPSRATGSRDLSSVLPIIRHFHSLVLTDTARTPTFSRVFSTSLQEEDAPCNIRTATMDIQILDTCVASGFFKGITKLNLHLDPRSSSRSLRMFLAPLSHLHGLAALVLSVPISDRNYHDNSVCTDLMKLKSLKSLSLFGFPSAQAFPIFKLLSSCLLEEIEVHSAADWVAARDIFMKVAEWFPKLTSLICNCSPGVLLEVLGEPSASGTWCFPNLLALSLVTRLDGVQLVSVLQNRLQARSESGAVAGLNKLVLRKGYYTAVPRNEIVWGRSQDVLAYHELSKLVPNIYSVPVGVFL